MCLSLRPDSSGYQTFSKRLKNPPLLHFLSDWRGEDEGHGSMYTIWGPLCRWTFLNVCLSWAHPVVWTHNHRARLYCVRVCVLLYFYVYYLYFCCHLIVWLAPLFFDWCYSCSIFCICYILVSWNLPWNSALQSLFLLVLVEKQLLLLCNFPLGPAHPGSHLSSTTQSWPVPFFPMKLEALARKRPHSGLQSPKWLWDLKLNVRLLKPRALLDKV